MRCQSIKWLTAGSLPSAADGKISSVFAVRRMMSSTHHYMAGSLPSATDGKVFAVCHCRQTDQMGQLPGSTAGCHVSSLPSAADGKEPVAVGGRRQRACILALLSVFLLNPTIFITNIYDIYRYISKGHYRANI